MRAGSLEPEINAKETLKVFGDSVFRGRKLIAESIPRNRFAEAVTKIPGIAQANVQANRRALGNRCMM